MNKLRLPGTVLPDARIRVALMLCVALILTACGGAESASDDAGEPDDEGQAGAVSITYATGGASPPNEMEAAIFDDALLEQDLLENYGDAYELDMVATRGTPEAQGLLVSGQADFATLAFSTIATTVAQDAVPGGISVVAGHFVDGYPDYVSNDYLVLEDSGIESPEDLRGKTLGVNAVGSAVDVLLRVWLMDNGLDPATDVEFAEVGFGAMGAALREGRIDMGSFVQPFIAIEKQEGGVESLFTARDAVGENSAIAVVARNDFLEENPDAARAFLADWVSGLRWLTSEDNRDEAIEIISDITETPEETLDLFYGRPGDDYYRDPNGCASEEALQVGVDGMVQTGYLEEPIEIAPLVDHSFLPDDCS